MVLTPTLATLPWSVGHLSPKLDRAEVIVRTERAVGYTPIDDMAGTPSMSVPLASSRDGLPIGLQLSAAPGRDRLLLPLAYQLERGRQGRTARRGRPAGSRRAPGRELVARRVALSPAFGDHSVPGPEAEELLAFWTAHRLEVVILLDRAAGTPYEDYPTRFVRQLVDFAMRQLRAQGAEPDPVELEVLELVFANTRSALAHILLRFDDETAIRRAVTTFWSYQLPGLEGLRRALVTTAGAGSGSARTG